MTLYHAYGEDPRYVQLYFDKYLRMNPLYPALTLFNVGEVLSLSDVIPYDEFYETRFYKEWARPQGIVDVPFANLEKSATGSAVLAIRATNVMDWWTRMRGVECRFSFLMCAALY